MAQCLIVVAFVSVLVALAVVSVTLRLTRDAASASARASVSRLAMEYQAQLTLDLSNGIPAFEADTAAFVSSESSEVSTNWLSCQLVNPSSVANRPEPGPWRV